MKRQPQRTCSKSHMPTGEKRICTVQTLVAQGSAVLCGGHSGCLGAPKRDSWKLPRGNESRSEGRAVTKYKGRMEGERGGRGTARAETRRESQRAGRGATGACLPRDRGHSACPGGRPTFPPCSVYTVSEGVPRSPVSPLRRHTQL